MGLLMSDRNAAKALCFDVMGGLSDRLGRNLAFRRTRLVVLDRLRVDQSFWLRTQTWEQIRRQEQEQEPVWMGE